MRGGFPLYSLAICGVLVSPSKTTPPSPIPPPIHDDRSVIEVFVGDETAFLDRTIAQVSREREAQRDWKGLRTAAQLSDLSDTALIARDASKNYKDACRALHRSGKDDSLCLSSAGRAEVLAAQTSNVLSTTARIMPGPRLTQFISDRLRFDEAHLRSAERNGERLERAHQTNPTVEADLENLNSNEFEALRSAEESVSACFRLEAQSDQAHDCRRQADLQAERAGRVQQGAERAKKKVALLFSPSIFAAQ